MTAKHIIFELIGSLAHFDEALCTPDVRSFMQAHKAHWQTEDRPIHEYIKHYCEHRSVDQALLASQWNAYRASLQFTHGATELFEELTNSDLKLHILTDAGRYINVFIADHEPVFKQFSSITCSYHVRAAKPDLKAFKAVLRKTGAIPTECVMVGSSTEKDLAPASAIGMQTVRYSAGKDPLALLFSRLVRLANP